MITVGYVRLMARYNSWQNDQLMPILLDMPEAELTKDRSAFFGSTLGTANHLLCGDMLWLSRFDPSMGPPFEAFARWPTLHDDARAWASDRHRVDGKIRTWADAVGELDLLGDMKCTPADGGGILHAADQPCGATDVPPSNPSPWSNPRHADRCG